MSNHPLEDEEVICIVLMCHVPTQTWVNQAVRAPADGPPDIDAAVEEAKQAALDDLLNQLEQRGT